MNTISVNRLFQIFLKLFQPFSIHIFENLSKIEKYFIILKIEVNAVFKQESATKSN